jgi:integrase/recombinase XerC
MENLNLTRQEFNNYLILKALSKRTIELYLYYWDKFDCSKISQEYVNEFLLSQKNNGVARAFVKKILEFIKLGNFPREFKLFIGDIQLIQKSGRVRKKILDVLSITEIHQLTRGFPSERYAIACLLSFYCGLRVAELTTIKPLDFQWTPWLENPNNVGTLKVTGKGNKQRKVQLPPFLMARIYKFIREVASKTQQRDDCLFKFCPRRWGKVLEKASIRAIGKRVNPHLLRHSCGTWLVNERGWELHDVAHFLGHESIQTTQIYTHTTEQRVKDKYQEIFKSNETPKSESIDETGEDS